MLNKTTSHPATHPPYPQKIYCNKMWGILPQKVQLLLHLARIKFLIYARNTLDS